MSANIQKMQSVKSIREIDLKDKRILIRVDFNVPMDSELNISDDTRIREAIPTINYCIDNGAKSIILVSHLGRPKGKSDALSLKNVLKRLERLLSKDVVFVDSLENAQVTLNTLIDGSIVLLENIRFYEGKTTKPFQRSLQSCAMSMSMMPLGLLIANIPPHMESQITLRKRSRDCCLKKRSIPLQSPFQILCDPCY